MLRLWRRYWWPAWMRGEWAGEAMVALVRAASSYIPRCSFNTWLYRMCWRRVQDVSQWARSECRWEGQR